MRKRFISLAVVSAVFIGAWFGLAYRPARSTLRDLRDDVTTTRQEVQALEAKLQRLLALQANEGGARDVAQRIVGALPADPKVSDFILKVQDAADATGIDFLSIAPSLPAVTADAAASAPAPSPNASGENASQTSAPASRMRSIAVQIKADGDYFEIENFTLRMEQLARALRIDDFSLTGSQDQAGGTKLSASMKLQMFMLAPQAAAPAPTNQGT